jgi:uncharacterized surface protein with fasciclin (FAS1) repeats
MMNQHALPLLALAGACTASVLLSELVNAQHPSVDAPAADIVAVASGDTDFATLVSALQAADLVTALQGKGPFTVFAPNNAAFAKLPPGALDDLMKPANKKKLVDILKNHVAQGKITSAEIKSGLLKMLNGEKVQVVVDNGQVNFGDAQVLRADITASNGVIHVIDTVVMPD